MAQESSSIATFRGVGATGFELSIASLSAVRSECASRNVVRAIYCACAHARADDDV